MDFEKIGLYRMTHIENIPHILCYGITHRDSRHANPDYRAIGDKSLIDSRNKKYVHISNRCTIESNTPVIVLGEYIPFYFGVKMPMLYVMQHGGNFVEKATPPSDIIYLVCLLIDIIQLGNTYYFSDGHATNVYTSFFDKSKIKELPNIIDWEAIESSYWAGNDNLLLKCKKQTAFLVDGDILPKYLYRFGRYNDNAKERLIGMGVKSEKIKVIPKAYY